MITGVLFKLYRSSRRSIRNLILRAVKSLENGEFYSPTLRKIFKEYHGVDIGLYTYGGCFVVDGFDIHTTVGRYCSIAYGVRVMNTNHPMNFKSMHPFFYSADFGYIEQELLEYIPLTIGNDVWMGYQSNILPKVRRIGDGAVIGAGSVVTDDIPAYAIVAGNPAKLIRYRFDQKTIDALIHSSWWEKPITELKAEMSQFLQPYSLQS
ncbi:MAG: CatB-related O-acetyltransferase [Chitinivibrionales bacterium]|nr:CatB-related O-acetyltransferase [Chitinivibrionales bacterium]